MVKRKLQVLFSLLGFCSVVTASVGGTVEVSSLEGEAISNGLCELVEAVETIQTKTNIDGCVYRENRGYYSYSDVILFGPRLFQTGALPKTISLVQALSLVVDREWIIDGPGANALVITSKEDSREPILTLTGLYEKEAHRFALRNLSLHYRGNHPDKTCIQGPRDIPDAAVVDGAVYTLDFDTVLISGCTGSAIRGGNFVHIYNSVLTNNKGRCGGAVSLDGALSVSGSIFRGNQAWLGGAICGTVGQYAVQISGSDFSGNMAAQGGAIYFDGDRTATTLEIDIVNTTIAHNFAGLEGGGIYWSAQMPLKLTYATVVQNMAGREVWGQGGGIFSPGKREARLSLWNSVLNDNMQNTADGFLRSDLRLFGSAKLVAAHSAIRNDGGISYEMDEANLKGIDPKLSSHALYGVRNHAFPGRYQMEFYSPERGSPLIDAASPSLSPFVTTDQPGENRTSLVNENPDIGAVEYNSGSGVIEFVPDSYVFLADMGTVAVPVQRVQGFNGAVSVTCQDLLDPLENQAKPEIDYLSMKVTLHWSDGQGGFQYCPLVLLNTYSVLPSRNLILHLDNVLGGAGLGRDKIQIGIH